MGWSPKSELVKKAREVAEKKHPEGFNKPQLIQASKEVFGGRGESGGAVYKKIENETDINDQRNAMAYIDGHYPVGMSDCFVVGINGDCGINCPVFERGDCEVEDPDAFLDEIREEGDIEHVKKLYPNINEFQNLKTN